MRPDGGEAESGFRFKFFRRLCFVLRRDGKPAHLDRTGIGFEAQIRIGEPVRRIEELAAAKTGGPDFCKPRFLNGDQLGGGAVNENARAAV